MMTASVANPTTAPNVFTGTLVQMTGPAFNAVPFTPSFVRDFSVGIGTLNFTDAPLRTSIEMYECRSEWKSQTLPASSTGHRNRDCSRRSRSATQARRPSGCRWGW